MSPAPSDVICGLYATCPKCGSHGHHCHRSPGHAAPCDTECWEHRLAQLDLDEARLQALVGPELRALPLQPEVKP